MLYKSVSVSHNSFMFAKPVSFGMIKGRIPIVLFLISIFSCLLLFICDHTTLYSWCNSYLFAWDPQLITPSSVCYL